MPYPAMRPSIKVDTFVRAILFSTCLLSSKLAKSFAQLVAYALKNAQSFFLVAHGGRGILDAPMDSLGVTVSKSIGIVGVSLSLNY